VREFLNLWKEFSGRACIHHENDYRDDPADRAKLWAFFQENDNITARVLMAVALGPGTCQMMKKRMDSITGGTAK
jgi:hypothetical protein